MKLGLSPEEFKDIPRWGRIALIRDLSGAAALDGGAMGAAYARFARNTRIPLAEQQVC